MAGKKRSKTRPLTVKESKFVKCLNAGMNKRESAIVAGYSPRHPSQYANRILKREPIIKALEKIGLTDLAIAEGIKINAESGMGVKATASDSIRALELASRLKGYLEKEAPDSLTQNNYTIELKDKSEDELLDMVKDLTEEIKKLS